MSYFDDNEDRIIYGMGRPRRRSAPPPINRAKLKAPPGSELARARIAAHAAFDPLWQSGKFSRGVAYECLASELGIPVTACHMVLMDVAMCHRVVAICQAHPACKQAAFDVAAADFEDLDK